MIVCNSLQDFSKNKIKLETFQKEKIDKAFIFADKISEFHECKVEIQFIMRNEEQGYIDNVLFLLKHDSLKITIEFYDYSKRYMIKCLDIDKIENVSLSQITRQKNLIGEPKNMRTLSKLKIKEWIKFHEKVYPLVAEVKKENDKKRDELIKKFSIFPIQWQIKDSKGFISLNGLRYNFHIEPNFFSDSMEIEDIKGKDKFGHFIKLSNNTLNTF